MIDLEGKTALVTGAGLGIGRACAEMLNSVGANLVLLSRSQSNLAKTVELINQTGSFPTFYAVDLLNKNDIMEVIEDIKKSIHIDILVNNAGFDRPGTVLKTEIKDFLDMMDIHITVPFILMKLLMGDMCKAGWGRIISISSICGLIGIKGGAAYSAAKAGIIGLTKSAAREVAKSGVTVNAIIPGLTNTPAIQRMMADKYKKLIMQATPMDRLAEPDEIAGVVAFIASQEASYMTGAAVHVTGGWGM